MTISGFARASTRWRVRPCEARLALALIDGLEHRKDALADVISEKDILPKSIDVLLCLLRKRIAPLRIETRWGGFIRMPPETCAAIKAVACPPAERAA